MKHIVHIMTSLGCGGLEKVVLNVVNATCGTVRHSVISLTDDLTMAGELPHDIQLHVVHKKEGRDLAVYWRIFKLLRALNPDVVNTYNFGTMEYQALAWMARCPVRVHVDHGLGGDPSDGQDKRRQLFRKAMSSLLQSYVVVSDDLRKFITQTVGVKESKVHLIRNGIALERGRHEPTKSREGLTLMTVGRLVEVKNQQALIRIAHQWNHNNPKLPPVHVVLVGDGDLRGALEQLTAELGAGDTTHFMGQTMTPWQYAEQADAFILTSLYEAMPMAVLEAMARAIPVLCAKVGGVGDFISSNEAVLFQGNNDQALYQAIDKLYHRPRHDRQRLGEKGFAFVRDNFSMTHMVNGYLSVWKEPPQEREGSSK